MPSHRTVAVDDGEEEFDLSALLVNEILDYKQVLGLFDAFPIPPLQETILDPKMLFSQPSFGS